VEIQLRALNSRGVSEHRDPAFKGFTHRYNVNRLVYYEEFGDSLAAIAREKQQIKGGSRAKKIALIDGMNPEWQDLFDGLL
jgi:putative endonuclease